MRARQQLRFWLIGLGVFVVALYLLRGMLLPFVLGMAAAYLLDPAADRFVRWGMQRVWATALLSTLFFILMLLVGVVLLPLIYGQVTAFVEHLPDYIHELRDSLVPALQEFADRFTLGDEGALSVRQALTDLAQKGVGTVAAAVGGLWGRSLALFNLLSLLLITPVVTFYLLRDWHRLVDVVDGMLPRQHADVLRQQARRVDDVLAGFVRGQVLVSLCMSVFYGTALSLVGLEFGLVIGLGTGILQFVPFLGIMAGSVTAFAMGLLQWGLSPIHLGSLALVFIIGQTFENGFLAPRLLSGRVGLHPLWVIFSVLAGASLFGFVGILIAVPVSASTGVLVRYLLERYRASHLYLGPTGSSLGE